MKEAQKPRTQYEDRITADPRQRHVVRKLLDEPYVDAIPDRLLAGRFLVEVLAVRVELRFIDHADPLDPRTARAFDIVGADGTSTIVTLHRRPALPPPD